MTLTTEAGSVLRRLTAIRIDDLVLHESVEPARLRSVAQALRSDGVLKNPVLATPLAGGKWLVIDGAHRVSALRLIGADLALVQVFEPTECHVSAWHHLVGTRRMPAGIARLLLERCPACDRNRCQPAGVCVAVAHLAGRTGHVWCDTAEINGAVSMLSELASSCATAGRVWRISPEDHMPTGAAARRLRIAYWPWSFDRLRHLAERRLMLPAGVTRFIVPGRVLGADIPLSLLSVAVGSPTASDEIRQHVEKLTLRYYAEPVFLGE